MATLDVGASFRVITYVISREGRGAVRDRCHGHSEMVLKHGEKIMGLAKWVRSRLPEGAITGCGDWSPQGEGGLFVVGVQVPHSILKVNLH